MGHPFSQHPRPAEGVKAEWNQENGEGDNEDALENLVAGGARHAAHPQVEADDQGKADVEHPRLEVGNIGMQLVAHVQIIELDELGLLLRRERAGLGRSLQGAVLPVLDDLPLFLRRPGRLRFGQKRSCDIVAHEVAPADEHAHIGDLIERVDFRKIVTAETFLEQFGHGHQAHPAEPYVHEPIVGVHEDGLEGHPGAGGALLVNERCGAHGAVRVRGVAEVEEELVELAELSAGQEEAFFAARVGRRTLAEVEDAAEIRGNDHDIDNMDSTHR